jgi:hypothetical protein
MPRQIPVGLDPSVSGLAAEIGEVVSAADGSAVWTKTGPGVTDWEAYNEPSDPGLATVSTGDTLTGDGSEGSPLDVVDDDAWFRQQRAAMLVLAPALTRFQPLTMGLKANGSVDATIAVTPGAIDGGAVGVAHDTNYLLLTLPVFGAPKTRSWAVTYRCKYPAIASAKAAFVGLSVDATTPNVIFGWLHSSSATKWFAGLGGAPGVTATNAHANWCNVCLAFDGTTVKAHVDGAEIATNASLGAMSDSPCALSMFSHASLTPGVLVSRIAYGYIDPT